MGTTSENWSLQWYSNFKIPTSRKRLCSVGYYCIYRNIYLDHQVIPGSQYYYKIRPLLLPVANVEPLQFTEIMGYKAFDENQVPETPQGLQVAPGEKGVELQWKPNPELNLHGYYILRGTSKRNIRLLAGPIRDYKYVDSTLAKDRKSTRLNSSH